MKEKKLETKVLISSGIGSLLEMYDFSLYAYFAPIIGALFFPVNNELVGLIATFGVFSIGYLMRPLGALIFGHLGDLFGRKKMLIISVLLMGIPTFLTGCLPTYSEIGILAPIFLLLVRILQGLSVGSEFAGATVFIGEHATNKNRGFLCSWVIFGIILGLLLGSSSAAGVSSVLARETLLSWGWRVLFLLSMVITPIAYYIRKSLPETPVFLEMQKENLLEKTPLKVLFHHHWHNIINAAGIAWVCAACVGLIFVYMSSYLTAVLHFRFSESLIMNSLSMFFSLCLIPFMGALSDRLGRKPLLLFGSFGLLVFAYPLFFLLNHTHSQIEITLALCSLGFFGSAILGAFSATIVEIFPSNVRYSGVAISYNVMAGTGPLIASFLIWLTNDPASPSYYLIFSAIVSCIFIIRLKIHHAK